MKKTIFLGIFLCLNTILYGQINFTDLNFKNAILNNPSSIDTNNDGEVTIQEAEKFDGHLKLINKGITNANELKYFKNISRLDISNNKLSNVDLSNNLRISELRIQLNKLSSLDISKNLNLKLVYCNNNELTKLITGPLNANRLKELNCFTNKLQNIDISELKLLETLRIYENELSTINLTNNGELKTLEIGQNRLTTLDVTQNSLLDILGFHDNNISTLDVTQNSQLSVLSCNSNRLQNLDISNNILLKILRIEKNQFVTINTDSNINLERFRAQKNALTNLNVSNNRKLKTLYVNENLLTSIDLTNNTNLTGLIISNNKLRTLDVTNCQLKGIWFDNNPEISSAYLSGQKLEQNPNTPIGINLKFSGCPKLQVLCIDSEYVEPTINALGSLIYSRTFTNPLVSDNCKNLISGTVTYDINNNGCENADGIPFSNFKFGVSNTNGFKEVFSDNLGQYLVEGSDGVNFIFPLLENPQYFNTLTPTAPINLPNDGPNPVRNYCITPNGVHNDLEVTLIPIQTAIPGFDASYLIKYKNKGTNKQSGKITFDFPQDVSKFVSAQPSISNSTTNLLSWNFTDLKPQEFREIRVVLKINRPTETPSVNSGDILNLKATALAATDGTPENNIAVFNQTVVNSFDPNDKICLQGTTIEPKDVGKYLHYMIRFENKGTANAINIRIEDQIDITKLNIKSFIPLQSSHPYTAIINNQKEIEFLFDNINLPFDDANNDGYVLFKIKTNENLKEGDVINNKAAIYFDFNLPIITDVESVSVKKKVISEPTFNDYFILSPNPTTGNLLLTPTNTNITVINISILDIAGNLVGFFPGTMKNLDVSYLFANTYFMTLQTDKGIFSSTFIKIN